MKMVLAGVAAALCLSVAYGAELSPEAQNVEVYDSVQRAIVDCQPFGKISGKGNGGTEAAALAAAREDLQETAVRQFKADTVAIIETLHNGSEVTINAYAYICNPK